MNIFDDEPQLDDLRLLLALMQHGTVTRASQKLGLSQSSLSHHLERMRRRFADELFVRVGNRMAATPFAERLGSAAARVLNVLETELNGITAFDPSTTNREFRIGLNEIGAIIMVPKLLRSLAAAAPGARLIPIQGASSKFASALESGELDVAAGHFDEMDDLLYQQLLYKREYVCIARLGHPSIGEAITLEEFSRTPQIQMAGASMTRAWVDAELNKRALRASFPTSSTLPMSSQHVAAIPFIVAASNMVALIPKEVYELFRPIAQIKIVAFPLPIPPIEIKQYWHPRVAGDAAVRFFRRSVYFATADAERLESAG